MRTRKRSYGSEEENSSCSSNIRQTTRQIKTKRISKQKATMMTSLPEDHQEAYLSLLEQVCSGENLSMKKSSNKNFWENFSARLHMTCNNDGRITKKACINYCKYLKTLNYEFQNPSKVRLLYVGLMAIQPAKFKKRLKRYLQMPSPFNPNTENFTKKQSTTPRSSSVSIHQPGASSSVDGANLCPEITKALVYFAGTNGKHRLTLDEISFISSYFQQNKGSTAIFLQLSTHKRFKLIEEKLRSEGYRL